MKLMSSLLVVVGLFALAVDYAGAQSAAQGIPFEKMDQNADGSVTPEELSAFSAQLFTRMDLNGDGSLSETEVTTAAQERAAERSKKRFALADADGDGAIDKDEFSQRREKRQAFLFNRFDANDDGRLSRTEAEEAWKARQGRN
ncbi:MAG: EF-hand domain-containing protein [Pseudomonadota bacterium]